MIMSMSLPVAQRNSHKASRSKASRKLFVEGLEGRQVLAGNVLATMIGGNLMIRGDSADNGLHIELQANGTVVVSGVEAGGSATTINGSASFEATDVRRLTRVQLGAGDDVLTVRSVASGEAGGSAGEDTSPNGAAGADTSGNMNSRLGRLQALRNLGDRLLGENATNRIENLVNNLLSRQHLLINTGRGDDTVDAEVSANVRVQMVGNTRGDDISIDTIIETDELSGSNATAAALNAATSANLDANVGLDIATALDLDTALTANLLNNPALNSASNLGTSSLLNLDNNLNGSIGGAAADNLLGDNPLADIVAGNLAGSANLSIDDATTAALLTGSSFNLAANAADDFFANLDAQSQANANLNTQAGLISNFGQNDALGNGALNSNINAAVSGAFQSQVGTVPLG
jgi:hypothetical protein